MSIRILLLLTIIGIIFVTLGLLGLYVDVNRRLIALNKSMRNADKAILDHNRRINTIEQRDRDASDHVYFCTDNELVEERDIKFGGEGI